MRLVVAGVQSITTIVQINCHSYKLSSNSLNVKFSCRPNQFDSGQMYFVWYQLEIGQLKVVAISICISELMFWFMQYIQGNRINGNIEAATIFQAHCFRWNPLPHLQQSLQRRKGWRRRSREPEVSQNQPVKKLHSRSKQRWTWTKKLDQIYKHFMRSLFV